MPGLEGNPICRFAGIGVSSTWRSMEKKLGIWSPSAFIDFAAQILVDREHGAELQEGPHDRDVDLEGAIAVESTRKEAGRQAWSCT